MYAMSEDSTVFLYNFGFFEDERKIEDYELLYF